MRDYIPGSKKPEFVIKIINEALDILKSAGIPFDGKSGRALEKMAMTFLAVAGVRSDWSDAKGAAEDRHLKTREIITIINNCFFEKISPGSYDDIRRKDLKLLVLADLIRNSGDKFGSATNDPTRGYALDPDFKNLIVKYNSPEWEAALEVFNHSREKLSEILARKRNLDKIPVTLPGNILLQLSLGQHNILQKAVVEELLPRYGQSCKVLYLGDTSYKALHMEREDLRKLNFFELSHDELPDVIAYDAERNWLYLIEAVHSSGPMSEPRVYTLKKMLKDCPAELIFITAFLTKDVFKRWASEIAWESEVWVADNPDHMIHFNGHKFLGPFKG
jgi:type II restriction enzyme